MKKKLLKNIIIIPQNDKIYNFVYSRFKFRKPYFFSKITKIKPEFILQSKDIRLDEEFNKDSLFIFDFRNFKYENLNKIIIENYEYCYNNKELKYIYFLNILNENLIPNLIILSKINDINKINKIINLKNSFILEEFNNYNKFLNIINNYKKLIFLNNQLFENLYNININKKIIFLEEQTNFI